MSTKISATVPDELAASVRLTAEKWGISYSEVVRLAVEVFTGSEQDQFFMLGDRERSDAGND